MIGHGVCTVDRLRVLHRQIPEAKLVPLCLKLIGFFAQFWMRCDIDVLEINRCFWHVNLNVAASFKIQGLTLR